MKTALETKKEIAEGQKFFEDSVEKEVRKELEKQFNEQREKEQKKISETGEPLKGYCYLEEDWNKQFIAYTILKRYGYKVLMGAKIIQLQIRKDLEEVGIKIPEDFDALFYTRGE